MKSAQQNVSHIDDSGQRPVIRGTYIRVSQIANEFEHLGMTADEIVEAHPHISLDEVHAALAHFYDHPALIRSEWQEAHAFIAEMRLRYPSRLNR